MSHSRRLRHGAQGFTVLEVLLSVLIVGLVLTVVYSAFRAGSQACRFGSERAQVFHTARIAMQDIVGAIENLEYGTNDYYAFIGKSESGIAPNGQSVDDDELEFATSTEPTWRDGRWQAGLARVRYAIGRGRASRIGQEHDVVLQKWVTSIEDEEFDEAYIDELSDAIVGLDFSYLDEDDYDENWDTDIKERLPQVIEITMYVRENDIIHPFRSAAMIPTMRVQSGTVTRSAEADGNAGAVNEAGPRAIQAPARIGDGADRSDDEGD
jgi:prepilin-type N-terminal cleavage/methylation domain-containing protein